MPITWTVDQTDETIIDDMLTNTSSARKVFQVSADSPVTLAQAFLASDGTTTVPQRGEAFSIDRAYCLLRRRSGKRLSPLALTLTFEFEDPTAGDSPTNLLALPLKIDVTSSREMEEYSIDRSTSPAPVQNDAGEPFDPGPRRLVNIKQYRLQKYVATATKTSIEAAEHTTNSSALTLDGREWAINQLLLVNASFTSIDTSGTGVWLATMEIDATTQTDGWVDKILDYGFCEISGTERKRITEKDAYGRDVPVSRPWPLNNDGTKKSSPTATPNILTFTPYLQTAWTEVPLT